MPGGRGRLEAGQVAKRAVSKTSGLKRGSSGSAGTQGTGWAWCDSQRSGARRTGREMKK